MQQFVTSQYTVLNFISLPVTFIIGQLVLQKKYQCNKLQFHADGAQKIKPVYHCTYNQDQWGIICELFLFLFGSGKV